MEKRGVFCAKDINGELVPVWHARAYKTGQYKTGACPQCWGAVEEEEEFQEESYSEIAEEGKYEKICKCNLS